MRVAFITHYTSLHGANRSLLGLIDGLGGYDVIPYVVAPEEGAITNELRQRNVTTATVPMSPWVAKERPTCDVGMNPAKRLYWYAKSRRHALQRLSANIRELPTFVKQLRSWNIDLIHTNTSVIPIGAMAARVMRLPHVWHVREFVDLHYGLEYDWGINFFRYCIGKADARIAISNSIRDYHLKRCCGKDTHVIYNGVASAAEFDRLLAKTQSSVGRGDDKPFTFALVGIIHSAKGQETAIRALAQLVNDCPEVRLLIVGAGDAAPLRSLADELGVSGNIEMWGYINDPQRAYFESDAVLMCSTYEAMGRVTAEAMAACRPVIGYDSSGTAEIIEHGHTGLLYRGGPEELSECMRRFVLNPTWARQLGMHGWQVASKKYTFERYAKSVYEVFSSVVRLSPRVQDGAGRN